MNRFYSMLVATWALSVTMAVVALFGTVADAGLVDDVQGIRRVMGLLWSMALLLLVYPVVDGACAFVGQRYRPPAWAYGLALLAMLGGGAIGFQKILIGYEGAEALRLGGAFALIISMPLLGELLSHDSVGPRLARAIGQQPDVSAGVQDE